MIVAHGVECKNFFHAAQHPYLFGRKTSFEFFFQLIDAQMKGRRFVCSKRAHGKIEGEHFIERKKNRRQELVLQYAVSTVSAVFGIYRHADVFERGYVAERRTFRYVVVTHYVGEVKRIFII